MSADHVARPNAQQARFGGSPRRGAAAVEFAVCAPVLFLLVLGLIEFGRMVMCYQVMTNAAREGARLGVLAGASSSDVVNLVNQKLSSSSVRGATVSVQPGEVAVLSAGTTFTVTAEVPFQNVSWLPAQWLLGRDLRTYCVMTREDRAAP